MIGYLLIGMFTGLAIGCYIGQLSESKYWASKAKDTFKTAVHHMGEFYYVIHEKEYNEIRQSLIRVKQSLESAEKSAEDYTKNIRPAVFVHVDETDDGK